MLKRIKFGVQFYNADGSKSFGCNRDLPFDLGMTAITGLNGEGKSLVLEMIQFAYFGIAALRGVSEDYKELWVEHEAEIKGQPVTIHRTISKATLYEGHGIDPKTAKKLASGTKAVNQAIKDLFGYSMAVFQVANAINQKQVDTFCAMLPTARKKLVDETIGLSALDTLVKWIGDKETFLKAQIAARSGLLIEPVAPTQPEGYDPSPALAEKLLGLTALRRQRDGAAARANLPVAFPPVVALETDDAELERFQDQQARYASLVTEATLLQRDFDALGTIPNVVATCLEDDDGQLEAYRTDQGTRIQVTTQRNSLAAQFNAIPASSYTAGQLDGLEAANKMHRRWHERQALLDKGIGYHCDKCGHDGHMHDPRVESEYADVPEQLPAVNSSALSDDTIIRQRAVLARQQERADLERKVFECDEYLTSNPDRSARITAIERARRAVQAQQEGIQKQCRHTQLTAQRADLGQRLVANPACQADIDRIMQKRHAHALYQSALTNAHSRQREVDEAKAELATFSATLDDEVQNLENIRYLSAAYSANLANYNAAKAAYDANLATQQEMEAELGEWAKGKLAISDLRTRIKAFLLPSLNKVASYLVNEFTGGVIPWLAINDDFEVIVDGKRVETLSGGGKTAANLAIRIGLGQVLTNQVFPVLMLDEPDESCDENRAAFIEKTLLVLREKMKQIILVTHKTGESADHLIRFG